MIWINEILTIDESELRWEFSRSSGPGGQNVNKVETRVTLCFDVLHSESLNDFQREKIMTLLSGRISRDGILRVSSSRHRKRESNRRECRNRWAELLEGVLKEDPPRKKTRLSKAKKNKRKKYKIRRSQLKESRQRVRGDE